MTSNPEARAQDLDAAKIIYYCKNCKKAIEPVRIGKKFRFRCADCKGSDVPFGTVRSITNFYNIERGNIPEEPDEKAKKRYKSFDEYLDEIKKK